MIKRVPIVICRLCDKNGNILNAYDKNSIKFTELTSPECRLRRPMECISGRFAKYSYAKVLIEGYVSVSIDERNLSAPTPFRIIQHICFCAPDNALLEFTVNNFVCQAVPFWNCHTEFLRVMVNIETRVCVSGNRMIEADKGSSVIVNQTFDTIRLLSSASLIYKLTPIYAKTYQYTAISDGIKRIYTDEDELKEYGDEGIFSPDEVSYYNLYVNGVLQPKVNYIMTKGRLEFITEDLPVQSATIILKYIMFVNGCISFTDNQYYAIADGIKKKYTNDDELREYSTNGIPGPDEVSYYNLYVNGVLQTKENYIVEKGLLKFMTTDIPQKGRSIILESIGIKDSCGRFLEVEEYQFDTISDKSRADCSDDNIIPYGQGILSPRLTSYQNLLVNAVNQPKIDYQVADNCLVFKTADLPTVESPITLQSVRVLNKPCLRRPCVNCTCLCLMAFAVCHRHK